MFKILVVEDDKLMNALLSYEGYELSEVGNGDYTAQINLKEPDEFIQLNHRFNNMVKEINSVELLRSDFVNNFSHEFKTPIVSIRGFAKMLKRDDLTANERMNI